ncbi:MAG TPA: hypothetical protein VGD00_10580 [Solirubrobacteraceae bacterium]
MAAGASSSAAPSAFDPAAHQSFRFLDRRLAPDGEVTLRYALSGGPEFAERIALPVSAPLGAEQIARVQGLLSLLHWVAGVSYYKTALPPAVSFERDEPGPAACALLAALYSEGLGELAYRNGLPELPRPRFAAGTAAGGEPAPASAAERAEMPARMLVPVGGGKDSAVAIEVVRRAAADTALFSIGDAPPIARTAAVAGLPHLIARRTLDPLLFELNAAGAINGHIPITAIVSCVALLSAALNGFDAVAMANERSASAGNLRWHGVDVNHQFSKGLRAERLLSAALRELDGPAPRCFSVLRPASELAIARGFARMESYHHAFTSCNAIFRLDESLRASSWCCDCPKCRFVFLALAPFSSPEHLRELFGADLLADEGQYEGFALLAASGGHKPFECVGEEQESIAAMRLLAADGSWREHTVVRRLAAELLGSLPPGEGEPDAVLGLRDDHDVPDALLASLDALLRA